MQRDRAGSGGARKRGWGGGGRGGAVAKEYAAK